MKDSSNDREKWSSMGGSRFSSTWSKVYTHTHTRLHVNSCRFKGIAVKVARWPISKKKKNPDDGLYLLSLSKGVYTIYDVSWNRDYRYSKRMELILLKFIEMK